MSRVSALLIGLFSQVGALKIGFSVDWLIGPIRKFVFHVKHFGTLRRSGPSPSWERSCRGVSTRRRG